MQTTIQLYNLDAEIEVLKAFSFAPDLIANTDLKTSDFYRESHRLIYEAMLQLYMEGIRPDIVSLMEQNKDLDKSLLFHVLREAITPANIDYHSLIVKDFSKRRRYQKTISYLQRHVTDDDFIKQTEMKLLELQDDDRKINPCVKDLLGKMADDRKEASRQERYGVQTGFPKLNECIVGLCKKHLIVLGAYTSYGKSSFLSQVVNDIGPGARVLMFSVEDSAEDKLTRLIATQTGIPIRTIVRGRFAVEQDEAIEEAVRTLENMKLNVYDDCYSLDEMELKIKKHCMQGGLDVVCIDFVQNIITGGESIYDRMSEVAIRLQRMAKKHNVCILALSQVSKDEKGQIALRGAQELASAADIVLWIDRAPDTREFSLIVRKNRPFGKTGKILMEFNEEWTGITESN